MNKISLKIVGNPTSNAGPEPLININNAYFPIPDTSYAGVSGVPFFFVVSAGEQQVVYKMVVNRVQSEGSSREGMLVIGIGIPRGFAIAGGVSPAKVLEEVKNLFMSTYMTCVDSAQGRYQFKPEATSPDPAPFESLISRYSLVPVRAPRMSMNPSGQTAYIPLSTEKIHELLSDVNYPQFAPYNEIVVAESIEGAAPIISVSVPRVPVYTITVNGKLHERVTDINKPIEVQLPATADSRGAQVRFTVGQLLEGKNVPGVSYNPDTETVSVQLVTETIEAPYRIVINPEKTLASYPKLTLTLGGRVISPAANGTYMLPPSQASMVQVSYGGQDYEITECRLAGNEYQVGIRPRQSVQKESTFLGMKPWVAFVVGIFIGLLLGLMTAFLLSYIRSDSDPVEEADRMDDPARTRMDKEQFEKRLKGLFTDDISFNEINEMYDFFDANRDICIQIDSMGCIKLQSYNELVDAITEDQFDTLLVIIDPATERALNIDPAHIQTVRTLFWVSESTPVDKTIQIEKRKEYLHNHHHEFNSFSTLPTSLEEPQSAPASTTNESSN